jgi:hypothetical protein
MFTVDDLDRMNIVESEGDMRPPIYAFYSKTSVKPSGLHSPGS